MKHNYAVVCIAIACAGMLLLSVQAGTVSPAYSQGQQKTFATAGEAIRALVDAFRTSSDQKLTEILGAENGDLVSTKDKAQDALTRKKIYAMACEKLVQEKYGKDGISIALGKQEWIFPFPLVKEGKVWRFDGTKGREELINRRVGKDELNAIAVCHYYVKAQREYAARDRNNDDIMEYALKFRSSKGKMDGLYWPSDPSHKGGVSPFEALFEKSRKYALARKQNEPFYGYYFRILTKQGEMAPGGTYDYIINGHMVAGFALIAYPADYGVSGVMTFMVNQRGKVYEKDLGADTVKTAAEINGYNPDKTWKLVQENGSLAAD